MNGKLYIGGAWQPKPVRISYLETEDGLPCIDTGIVPDANTKVELGFKCTAAVAWMGVVGNYIDDSHNCVRLAQANNPNRYIANPNTNAGNATTVYKAVTYGWQTASISQAKCIVDNVQATPTLTQGTANTTHIALLKNRVTDAVVGTRARISWCKIYEAGVLVRDFVPFRIGTVGYMLDLLTNTFYGNAGAGAFVLGADLEPEAEPIYADCDEQSLALFTYRREDLDNPTVVRNSYTQQIRLKGTPANDAIFGHILQGTRITGGGFDASARTPFVLYGNGGEVLESGYCKLDGIERHGADHTYLVTLFGGLGEILYKLSAADDGRQLTLADLTYIDPDNPTDELDFTLNRAAVVAAWADLATGTDPLWSVVNFAFTNDPLPEGFQANMCFVDGDQDSDYPTHAIPTTGPAMVTIPGGTVATAQQVGDYRCYLQRPVLKVAAVFDAIGRYCTDHGWALTLDGDFFDAGNPYYGRAWMTLTSFATLGLGQDAAVTKAALLGGTMSPLAFLVGYCRHFGLVITADYIAHTLEIQPRAAFYADTLPVLDLGPRVDLGEQIAVAPLTYDARWYLMGEEVAGNTATLYGEKYRTPYGWQRIDTGYAFNQEERDLLEGQPFKGVATLCTEAVGNQWYNQVGAGYRIPPILRSVAGTTYHIVGGAIGNVATIQSEQPKVAGNPFVDLRDKDGKVVDAFCLLFFDGYRHYADPGEPSPNDGVVVSDDNPQWFVASYTGGDGGRPCWLATGTTTTRLQDLPVFSRMLSTDPDPDAETDDRPVLNLWDFNTPLEVYTPGYDTSAAVSLFGAYWAAYLADRYDIDARVATVRADLHGLPRPAELLRHFVWWDGALWSVNAVQEWDPLGEGTTTLELVRVKNPNNYR